LLRPVNSVLGPKTRGFSRESGQDHRNYDHRDSQYPAFRSFFRLTGRLILSRVVLACLVAFLLLGCQAATIVAQQEGDDDEVVRVNTDLLLFPIRIRDKKGQPVAGLTEADLILKDQDRVTTGLYFSPGADRVALLFALDQSGSLREIISQQQDAALSLFSRFSDRSSIAVLRFSDTPLLVEPFTKDVDAARAAFRFFAARDRQTAIFDAAKKSVQAFDTLPLVRAERRIVILISDGLDNRSTTKADSVINAAIEQRVSFYVIHLPLFEPRDGRLAVRRPSKGFRELAEKTGGKYFLLGDGKSALQPGPTDLSPIFQAIEDDLKSQYLLGFYIAESSRDNRKHVFSVSLKAEGVEYAVGGLGFSRTHKFMINLRPSK
jgi:Ca-activated chloride channel family protein